MTRRQTPAALRRPIPRTDPDDEPESTERPTVNPPFDVETFARQSDSKLRAVPPVSGTRSTGTTVDEVRRCMAAGQHEEALRRANATLAVVPLHAELRELAMECTTVLERTYLERIGGFAAIPVVAIGAG